MAAVAAALASFPNFRRVRGFIRLSEYQITGVTVLAMVLNVLFKSLERRFKAPMIMTTTRVAIRAYSIAVVPDSSIFSFSIILPITTPTLQFFAETADCFGGGGRRHIEVARIPGYLRPFHFLAMFQYVREIAYETTDYRSYLQAKFNAQTKEGKTVSPW
jgi:hypothetical protein